MLSDYVSQGYFSQARERWNTLNYKLHVNDFDQVFRYTNIDLGCIYMNIAPYGNLSNALCRLRLLDIDGVKRLN